MSRLTKDEKRFLADLVVRITESLYISSSGNITYKLSGDNGNFILKCLTTGTCLFLTYNESTKSMDVVRYFEGSSKYVWNTEEAQKDMARRVLSLVKKIDATGIDLDYIMFRGGFNPVMIKKIYNSDGSCGLIACD